MKSDRHAEILKIIENNSIETQDELLGKLKAAGFKATQATISRDIKDLRLVKALGNDGRYRYIAAEPPGTDVRKNLGALLNSSMISMETAQNIVVIKTLGGMANAVCASIDAREYRAIVGTIAGDDTIFIACRDSSLAAELVSEFKKLV